MGYGLGRRWFWWLIATTYWAILTYGLLAVAPWDLIGGPEQLGPNFDPSATFPSLTLHFISYGLLAFLIRQATKERLWSWYFAIAFHGLFVEILQGYIPGRWANPVDMAANLIGLSLVWFSPELRRLITTPG